MVSSQQFGPIPLYKSVDSSDDTPMIQRKYDMIMVGIGLLLVAMPVAYLVSGPVALMAVGILTLAAVGHALFGMGVGQQLVE